MYSLLVTLWIVFNPRWRLANVFVLLSPSISEVVCYQKIDNIYHSYFKDSYHDKEKTLLYHFKGLRKKYSSNLLSLERLLHCFIQ